MSICDKIASRYNLSWKYSFDYKAYTTQLSNNTNDIIMLKSKYPMNMNGKSVKAIVKGLEVENIFVVHDDLDRPLGKLSLKTCGSAGGHNGVKSIISCLGTDKFQRLRIGIGRPINPNEVTRYVLADFDLSEKINLEMVQKHALEIILNELKFFVTDHTDLIAR
ncbi:peptidyl-tRNA hydrolase isoform X5 [Hydra vulgaris]